MFDYRERLLERFERLPAQFAQAIARLPETDWWLRRAADGRAVHEIMAHTRDVEVHAYLPRLQRILREDNPTLERLPSHDWSKADYDVTEPMESLLGQYAHAREEEVALVQNLGAAGWSRLGFHPPTGRRTAQWWVERALAHGLEHLGHIRAAR